MIYFNIYCINQYIISIFLHLITDLNTNQHCKYIMSFLARWINENLLKRKTIQNQEPIKNQKNQPNDAINSNNLSNVVPEEQIMCTYDENSNYIKWIPNNELVKKYNKFLNNVAELNRQKHTLENKLVPRSKQLIKEYMKKSRSIDINDKIYASDLKKEMFVIEKKVIYAEKSIKELETMDSGIIDEWNKYLEDARDFLQLNNIDSEITIDDILSDDRLYIMGKKFLDGYCTMINSDNVLNTIQDIKRHFDIGSCKNTMNFSLVEYEEKRKKLLDYETENSLNVIKEAPKLFLRDINNNPIEYDLNINNNPVELSNDKISDLTNELNSELDDC